MRPFMDEEFLLTNETAKTLYHSYAEKMPIIDYHCHIDPAEIAQDRRFENITQLWLSGDHYKWRMIRSNGVEERLITGDAGDREKFEKFAETMPKAIGHPVYHWTHLELKRYFGCDLAIGPDTAEEIWQLTSKKLAEDDALSVRGIISSSGVQAIATTDDPADSLEWHTAIQKDPSCNVQVVPCFRPDKAVNIDKPGFIAYIETLGKSEDFRIQTIDDLQQVLCKRLDFFAAMGCLASDHGLDYVVYRPDPENRAGMIFKKALAGQNVSFEEAEIYKTALMLFFGRQLAKRGWVMQLHYGAIRNANTRMFQKIGPDTGFDCISTFDCSRQITGFLNALENTGELPKTVLYSLNPNDNGLLGSIIGCFQGSGAAGKIQHGSAWWFNDSKTGMEQQLTSLANHSLLGNFIGMLTDSRSFLSYTRHEYFRRVLCNLIGIWVENGEYPADIPILGEMIKDIAYRNTARYFGFGLKA